MITRIKNGKLILEKEIVTGQYLYFEDNTIIAITSKELPFHNEVDAASQYVSAGFIDLHVHGGNGYEFVDGTPESVISAANIHAQHGTSTIFPTLSAYDFHTTTRALEAIKSTIGKKELLSNIAGVHLEGPYFSHKQCGAQDATFIRNPDMTEYGSLVANYGDIIKRWSYAPELEGAIAFQRFLHDCGIVGSAGHTDAELVHMEAAMEYGLRLITHLYSCTSTIVRKGGYRHLGVIESAWLHEDLDVEAIADGSHLPPELIKMIYKLKGPEHMCLVTDAIRFAGQTDCSSAIGGTESVPYIIEDGVAKLADRSAFAGSIATGDVLIRTCVKKVGIPLVAAVKMMTEVPARIMKLNTKGKLAEGYDADILCFDEDIRVSCLIVGGEMKYRT